ncbi:MAG: hypothetical protein ACRC9L_00640 [Brevinema sp.]
MKCCFRLFFLTLILSAPLSVYSQLIDNRALPPEELLKRAPFIPTDRGAVRTKSTDLFYVLDNADNILIQDYPDNKITEVTMTGNVRVRFQRNSIRAEKIVITVKNSTTIGISASGNIEFTLNSVKYLANSMYYQPVSERGILYDVRSTINAGIGDSSLPWFYRAEKATLQGANRFALENVTLSTSDARFDHFSIFAKKVWFIQGKVTVALSAQYKVGQAGFIWIPAFLQLDSTGIIHTSFGSDRRAGYYFVNNISITNKRGQFNFGFDIYERLGQYFTTKYTAPKVGMLKEFDIEVNFANDTRVSYTNAPYSQWLLNQIPIVSADGTTTNFITSRDQISQFSWYYKFNAAIETNGINLKVSSEYLNDPFFLQKYSIRDSFAGEKSINTFGLINQGFDNTFNYGGDASPSKDTLEQRISLSVGKMSISTVINLGRLRNLEVANPFLNEAYRYDISSMTLPSISINPGSLALGSYDYKTNILISVVDSRGWSYSVLPYELPALERRLAKQTQKIISRRVQTNQDGVAEVVVLTNLEQVKITNKTENPYTFFSISSSASFNASFTGSHTYGSNIAGVNDPGNTNWRIINDTYRHSESGNMDITTSLFNGLVSIVNGFDANYVGQFSSFNTDITNNQRATTFSLRYRFSTTISSNFTWRDPDVTRMAVPLSMTLSYNQGLVNFNAFEDLTTILEGNLNWTTRLGWEFLQWQRVSLFKINGEVGISERYRFPTEDQATAISNQASPDPYFDNKLSSQLTVAGDFSFWWLSVGTRAVIDILNTRTNTNTSFTNRFTSDPVLTLTFRPDSRYSYIPSLSYWYRINAREDDRLDLVWNLSFKNIHVPKLYPFIYDISEIGFVFNYFHNFQNERDSFLRLSFVLSIRFTKYLTLRFESRMVNTDLDLYYLPASDPRSKNFFADLADSFKIWDITALQRTSFNIENFNFDLIHDLQTWDMRVRFSLRQIVDESRQVAYWEPFIGISFIMKGASSASIFPEYTRRLVPNEFQ